MLLPAIGALIVFFCLSIFSLVLSYMLRYKVILFDVRTFKVTVMKRFGLAGVGISVLIILCLMALDWWQRH